MRISGGLNHLALTVSDLERSTKFYDALLTHLGYSCAEVPAATQLAMKTTLRAWSGPGGAVTIRPAKPAFASLPHNRDAPGLNHFAFNAASREEVDALYTLLREIAAEILDPPTQYDYMPEYYAVYFRDPDGLKLEYAFSSF